MRGCMPKKNEVEAPKKKSNAGTKKGTPNVMKGKKRVMTPAILANPGGRPSEIDEAGPKIISYIRKGNTYECSAGCARVTYNTFNSWIRKGKEDRENGNKDSKYLKFLCDVEQAETEAELEVVNYWRNELPGNWQACKEFLARRNPDKWAARDRMDVTSNGETVGKAVFLPMKKTEDNEA
jgi:hypothetical protein